jgi:hypothetical protein
MTSEVLRKIIDYESGNLTNEDEVIEFFQELIDSGLAWKLQGHYAHKARELIAKGLCDV